MLSKLLKTWCKHHTVKPLCFVCGILSVQLKLQYVNLEMLKLKTIVTLKT